MPKKASRRAAPDLLDAFWSQPILRTVLANGLTVLVKRDTAAALASVQVWVKTGSIHEGAHLGAGLSHYLEHMLFKGTVRRAGKEIAATVQANGGYINAYTTFDRTVYYIDLPSERMEVAVDVLADAVLHSTLPEDEVEREKNVILREIAMTRDDPDNRLWDALFSTAFREHPYRQPIIGHQDVFAASDRAALEGYYRQRYVPNNMVVVIVGDVEPAAALASVERHFGQAPRSRLAPVLVPEEPRQLGPRSQNRFEKVEVTRAALAWQIPGITDPAAPAFDILSLVLGGGESALLWQEIREKKRLVHTIDASAWNPGTGGLFCISYTCDAGMRVEAEKAILSLLARISRPGSFSQAQASKAYRQSVVSEINTFKTMSGQASRLGVAEVVVGDLDFGRTFFERLRRVKPADLSALVRTYLQPSGLISVSIEPEAPAAKASKAAPSGRSVRPDFTTVTLKNGARIVFQRDPGLPNLHLRLVTHGGPLCEATDRRGSSALLATLLAKDTRRRSAAAVAARIEEVGGTFSAFAGENSLGLAGEVLPADAPRALELLEEAVLLPAFKASTLATEREAQLAALREERDDVVAFARRCMRQRFFGAHPFALGSQGDEAGVAATEPGDLAALWARLRIGSGVVLAVAGDFDPDRVLPRLETFLSRLPPGLVPEAGPLFEGPAQAGPFVVQQPREQAVVFQAYPGSVVNAADFYTAEVADELFSGMASRLFERVRDQKGLAYFVRSGRISGRSAASFYFMAGTQPGKENEVMDEIDLEIARVQAGDIATEELLRCQVRLKAGQTKALQTNSSRAMTAALDVLQGRDANHGKRYASLVDAVSVDDLAAYACAHFKKERGTRLVVRP